MHAESLALQSVVIGRSRISVLAFLSSEALTWTDEDLAELREAGACAAVLSSAQALNHLSPLAKKLGLPLLFFSQESHLPSGLQADGLIGKTLPVNQEDKSLSLPFFLLAGEPESGCCFIDEKYQISRYPLWSRTLDCPWGMALGLNGQAAEDWLPLALAGFTAGAQFALVTVKNPKELESLTGELKAFSAVLGRELTRIPKQTLPVAEQKTVSGAVRVRAAFQGEHGAYSEMAVFSVFDKTATTAVPIKTFREVYSAVLAGEVDYGVIPIENALAGPIQDNFDLLQEFPDLHIVAETQVRIEHNLIGLPQASVEDIKRVLSHPQGLAQSRVFLEGHPGWESVPFYDTAGSVAYIAQQNDKTMAAIASAEAARFYGMKILVPGIETNRQNFTRFFVLAPRKHAPLAKPNKASILFSTADEPGALSRCLAVFAAHGVNMKKLESRPIHGRPWEYLFFVDVQLPDNSADFDAALGELETVAKECRLLGRYRA